jgi:hypothetical protein
MFLRKFAMIALMGSVAALSTACFASFSSAQEQKQDEATYYQKAVQVIKGKKAVVGACAPDYPVDCGDFCCEGAHGCGGLSRPRCYGPEDEDDK